MPNFDLSCVVFPDLLAWEREAMAPLLAVLGKQRRVQEVAVSPARPRFPREKLGGEPLWVITRNWQKAVRWSRGYHGPVFISVLLLTHEAPPLPFLFIQRMRRQVPRHIHLLTHSPLCHRFFTEMEGLTEAQTSYLPLPAAAPVQRSAVRAMGPVIVGTMARFVAESNLNYFLNVAHYVSRREAGIQFRLLGAGALQGHLEQMVRDLSLDGTVQVVRGATASDVSALDCLLFVPLRNDHFIPVLYAAANGLAVLASEIPGVEALIADGQDGFVVPVNETKPMAELVLRLGRDASLRSMLGESLAKKLGDTYAVVKVVEAYEKLFFGKAAPAEVPAAA